MRLAWRILVGALAAAWAAVALFWLAVNGWIVPRIDQYRPALEQMATHALGVPVRIGTISAQRTWLLPTVVLSDVRVPDPDGGAALELPRVTAVPSLRSALVLQPVFTQIVLDRPMLAVRRLAGGGWLVAGTPVGTGAGGDDAELDWFFSQPEVIARNGRVLWRDDAQPAPAAAFTSVDAVLRNGGHRHRLRVDATPPAGWGARFDLRGDFTHALLTGRPGDLAHWSGSAYIDLPHLDTEPLARHAMLPAGLGAVRGALRSWLTLREGSWQGATLDLALDSLRLAAGDAPLDVATVSGRVVLDRRADGYRAQTSDLSFDLLPDHPGAPARAWMPSPLAASWQLDAQGTLTGGTLHAGRVDVALAAALAAHLPLPDGAHARLAELAPAGVAEDLDAAWQAPPGAPAHYRASGRLHGLALRAADVEPPQANGYVEPQRPGVHGADVRFAFSETGGRAGIAIRDGSITLPGIFEQPEVPLSRAEAELRWQRLPDGRYRVQAPDVALVNADATLHGNVTWTSGAANSPEGRAGTLALDGTLSDGAAGRVHRYLALGIPADVRHYVEHAVRGGTIARATFAIAGPLRDFPFSHPGSGTFHIRAEARDVTYDYAPAVLTGTTTRPWPVLAGVAATLDFTGTGMRVEHASGHAQRWPQIGFRDVRALIADFTHGAPTLEISGDVAGPLGTGFALVGQSAVGELLHGALDRASGSGTTRLALELALPLEQLDHARVTGNLRLDGNNLQPAPELPALRDVRGTIAFTEDSLHTGGLDARALGGTTRATGGWSATSGFDVQLAGSYDAAGLREELLPSAWAALGRRVTGGAGYTARLRSEGDRTRLQWRSDLAGLGLDLPAPLAKPASVTYPVTLEATLPTDAPTHLQPLDLAISAPARGTLPALDVRYRVDAGTERAAAPAVRGALGINAPATLPRSGVVAHLSLPRLDLSPWLALLPAAADGPAPPPAAPWWPHTVTLATGELVAAGHTLTDLNASAEAQPDGWRITGTARELAGEAQWLPAEDDPAGLVRARLSRLWLENTGTDAPAAGSASPTGQTRAPALDIEADDFRWHGYTLGRLALAASNRRSGDARQWHVDHLGLTLPEGTLSGQGDWTSTPAAGDRTALTLQLRASDVGALLARLGQPHVIAGGTGTLAGSLQWHGAPYAPDLPSLAGDLTLQLGAGRFTRADPGTTSRLLGVLSLQALPRRLTLDFRDVFSSGFAFDSAKGRFELREGTIHVDGLAIRGASADVNVSGSADFLQRTQQLRAVVSPQINAGAASLALTAVNPAVGLGSLAAQWMLRKPLMAMARRSYVITGAWDDPQIDETDTP